MRFNPFKREIKDGTLVQRIEKAARKLSGKIKIVYLPESILKISRFFLSKICLWIFLYWFITNAMRDVGFVYHDIILNDNVQYALFLFTDMDALQLWFIQYGLMLLGVVVFSILLLYGFYRWVWRLFFPDLNLVYYNDKKRLERFEGRCYWIERPDRFKFISDWGVKLFKVRVRFHHTHKNMNVVYFRQSVFPLLNPLNPSKSMAPPILTTAKIIRDGLHEIQIEASNLYRKNLGNKQYYFLSELDYENVKFDVMDWNDHIDNVIDDTVTNVSKSTFIDIDLQKAQLGRTILFMPPSLVRKEEELSAKGL